MKRKHTGHVLTDEDRKKAIEVRSSGAYARHLRREAELWLLNRLLAEAAMPEWYPRECKG